jgi:hypothetical protein
MKCKKLEAKKPLDNPSHCTKCYNYMCKILDEMGYKDNLPCDLPKTEIERLKEEGCFGIDEPLTDGKICVGCPVNEHFKEYI